jgi:hypothetical protein
MENKQDIEATAVDQAAQDRADFDYDLLHGNCIRGCRRKATTTRIVNGVVWNLCQEDAEIWDSNYAD